MPFEKAKTIIAKEIKDKNATLDSDAGLHYDAVKRKLTRTKEDFANYVTRLTYPESKGEVASYHGLVKAKMKTMLEDKKATADEMSKFYKLIFTRSETLKEALTEGQREHEEGKYKVIKKQVEADLKVANFKKAKGKLSTFLKTLNPLNRTDTTSQRVRYNLKESFLRLDMQIMEQSTNILEQELAYETVFKAADPTTYIDGNYFEGMPQPNYVIAKKDGQITLAEPTIDAKTGEVTVSKQKKTNWLTLISDITQGNYQAKALQVVKDSSDKFVFHGADFTEDSVKDPDKKQENYDKRKEILRNRAQLAEIRMLKQINTIYMMKDMEDLPKTSKEKLKKALQENLNSMRLYFFEFGGQILTTKEFENSDPLKKQAAFKKMLSGVQGILKRMGLEDTIKELNKKESLEGLTNLEKGKLKFAKGKLAMRTHRFIDAYSHFKGFLRMDHQPHEMELEATKHLRIASFRIIDIADRYITASVGQVPDAVTNQAFAHTKKIREILEQNPHIDLEEALTKADALWRKPVRTGKTGHYLSRGAERQGGGTSQLFPTSTSGNSKIILTLRGHILKRLALVATVIDDKDRQNALLDQAKYARENKLYGATGVLLKEAMQGEMGRHRRDLQRDPAYWTKAQGFRKFSYFERLNVAAKTAPRMAKKMLGAKKYAQLTEEERTKFTGKLTNMILQKRVAARERNYIFKSYLKKYKGSRSKAADSFIDMENPFDDWKPWKWSDKTWDGVKKTVLIDGVMIAVSGGVAGLGRGAATYGGRLLLARFLGARVAASLPARVATSLIGFGVEVLTFETAMRLQQHGISGKTFEGYWGSAWHSARTLGIMNVGGKFASRVLSKLKPFSKIPPEELGRFKTALQKAVPRSISAVGFEAPLTTYLSMKFDDVQGMSALQIYANSLKDIAAISLGRKIVNSATGNLLPKAMERLANRTQVLKLLGDKKVPLQVRRALESVRETGVDMKEFIKNPEKFLQIGEYVATQADVLLLLKLANPSALSPKEQKTLQNFKKGVIEKLKSFGIGGKRARQIFEGLTPRKLQRVFDSITKQERKLRELEEKADKTNERTREQTLGQLEVSEANEDLIRDTYFDKATGLSNRNGLSELDSMVKKGKKVVVVSSDGDHFKAYNDLKGMAYGDKVIKLIGSNMNQLIAKLRAKGHKVYGVRMGGEEIVIFGTSKKPGFKDLLHKEMQSMAKKLQKEIRSTLTKREIEKMAKRIYKEKYADDIDGLAKARREIGGTTASVVEVDASKLTNKKGATKKLLVLADEILEKGKNKTGRGQIIKHKKTAADTATELANFKPKNKLNIMQNQNLSRKTKALTEAARSHFRQYLPELNSLKATEMAKLELKRTLESPSTKTTDIVKILKKHKVKGDHAKLAQKLQKEHIQAIRDHGNYTGASTMNYFQNQLGKATPKFRYKDVRTVKIGEFKSINETLGHTGGDAFLTMVHMQVVQSAIRRLGIPKKHIMVSQKGADFKFCISEAYLKKHPKVQARLKRKIENGYKRQYAKFTRRMDRGSGNRYTDIRSAWIKKNKGTTKKQSIEDAKHLTITKETTTKK